MDWWPIKMSQESNFMFFEFLDAMMESNWANFIVWFEYRSQ